MECTISRDHRLWLAGVLICSSRCLKTSPIVRLVFEKGFVTVVGEGKETGLQKLCFDSSKFGATSVCYGLD